MKKLREWLLKNNKRQADLALLIGVHESAVSQWLNGHSRPTLDSLRKVSAVTGISIDDLALDIPAENAA